MGQDSRGRKRHVLGDDRRGGFLSRPIAGYRHDV
jgi:hypothetical protein